MESNQQFPQQEQKKNSKTILYAIIAVLGALNIGMGAMMWNSKSEQKSTENKLSAANAENSKLDDALKAAEEQLEHFRADSAALSEKNVTLSADLVNKKNEIARLVAQLKSTKTADNSKIEELNKKIAELQDSLTKLTEEHEELKKVHQETTDRLAAAENKNTQLEDKNAALNKENLKNKQKLTASAPQLKAYQKPGLFRKENEAEKAKKIKQFRLEFTVAENTIAEPGQRTFFVQMIGPDGVTLQNSSSQGGQTELDNGKTTKFTYQFEKMYDQADLNVKAEWNPTMELKPGKYVANIYCDGFLIGSSSATFK